MTNKKFIKRLWEDVVKKINENFIDILKITYHKAPIKFLGLSIVICSSILFTLTFVLFSVWLIFFRQNEIPTQTPPIFFYVLMVTGILIIIGGIIVDPRRFLGGKEKNNNLPSVSDNMEENNKKTDAVKQEIPRYLPNHDQIKNIISETDIEERIFSKVIEIADHLNRYGYEKRKIGTLFILGDFNGVKSKIAKDDDNIFKTPSQILDHATEERVKREAVKDGAFVITGDGLVMESRALVNAMNLKEIKVVGGSRHRNAAAITKVTKSISIAVSESGGVRIFKNGEEIT